MLLAFFGSSIIFKIIGKIKNYILCKAFKMRSLHGPDMIFLTQDKTVPSTIMLIMDIEKVDFDQYKKEWLSILDKFPESKSKIIDFMGDFYKQEMTSEEWNKVKDSRFVKLEGIDDEKKSVELAEKIHGAPEYQIDYRKEPICGKFYIVPDFNGVTRVFWQMNHTVFDALVMYTLVVAGNKKNKLPEFGNSTWQQKMKQYLLAPLYGPINIYEHYMYDKSLNPMKTKPYTTNNKSITIVELASKPIFRKCKELKVTFNQLCQAILSMSIKEYFVKHSDNKDKIVMSSTFMLRGFYENPYET